MPWYCSRVFWLGSVQRHATHWFVTPLQFFNKWARCLPMWGTMLAHVGHGACPCGARCLPQVGTTSIQNVPKAVQRRNARKGDEKRSKSLWHFDDTLMILFCKESRKVSLSQLVGTMDFIYMEKPENDTMTLLYRKNESMPRTWHTLNNTCLVTVK